MACHISSNDNRFYAVLEAGFGEAALAAGENRIPAVRLAVRHQHELPARRDKTGGRTFTGLPNGFRTRTSFELETLLTEWTAPGSEPAYGPLLRAALGAAPLFFSGGTVQTVVSPTEIALATPHGLVEGQAIRYGGELRFVSAIVNPTTVILNAPFVKPVLIGAAVGATVTYLPETELPSVSIHDYWDPEETVQRILAGSGINKMRIGINGDFHGFRFDGFSREMVDNVTFTAGQAGLADFPSEPAIGEFSSTVVPGNLGQAWFGTAPSQLFSVLEAEVELDNDLESRTLEFGMEGPQCLVAGRRSVNMHFRLFADTNPETNELYQAARQRSPVQVMLQLGQEAGQLCGVYMKSVVPDVPVFEDGDRRLEWKFRNSRAQGASNDELVVAFG